MSAETPSASPEATPNSKQTAQELGSAATRQYDGSAPTNIGETAEVGFFPGIGIATRVTGSK